MSWIDDKKSRQESELKNQGLKNKQEQAAEDNRLKEQEENAREYATKIAPYESTINELVSQANKELDQVGHSIKVRRDLSSLEFSSSKQLKIDSFDRKFYLSIEKRIGVKS